MRGIWHVIDGINVNAEVTFNLEGLFFCRCDCFGLYVYSSHVITILLLSAYKDCNNVKRRGYFFFFVLLVLK